MKVKDLILELKDLDPELDIIISSDAKGNHYSPFRYFYTGMYVPKNKRSGSFKGHADCEWEGIKYKENAILFCPN
ncbi:MAG: hypothetical protein PHY47_01195 [Lachnospiraceae bacterium]|nr:hypothetical protein [Lachnospiraceae bacterium]